MSDNPVIPDQPFSDPNTGRLPNPGDPQPENTGDSPTLDARVNALEQKVALLEQVVQPPGAPGTSGE